MTKANPSSGQSAESNKGNPVNKSPFIPEADFLIIGTKRKVEGLIKKAIQIYGTILGTNIEVKMLGDEYLVNGRKVLAINSGYWEFIDIETLEKVELYQKGTKKQIWFFSRKHKHGEKEYYETAFMGDNNKHTILCADSLEQAKMTTGRGKNEKEIAISEIVSEEVVNGKMIWNIVTKDNKTHIIIPRTMKELELRIEGTNEKIVGVYNKARRFGNIKIQNVLCENGKVKWIDTKTLEEVDMRLSGTNIKIIDVLGFESAGMNTLYKVEINDKNWGFKRDSDRQIVYIDSYTMEPLKYKGKYVTNIHRIDKNHISFNLNGETDIYIFETK